LSNDLNVVRSRVDHVDGILASARSDHDVGRTGEHERGPAVDQSRTAAVCGWQASQLDLACERHLTHLNGLIAAEAETVFIDKQRAARQIGREVAGHHLARLQGLKMVKARGSWGRFAANGHGGFLSPHEWRAICPHEWRAI